MAIDFTGITNKNEFYTHHYLNAIPEEDLKDLFKWKKLFQSIYSDYLGLLKLTH